MWGDAFLQQAESVGTIGHALLMRSVLPDGTTPHERASAVMITQLAATLQRTQERLIFMTPFSGDDLACVLTSGILISGADVRERKHVGSVLNGDLLLITHAVGSCLDQLRGIRLGGVALREIWPIDSFSRYEPVRSSKPRVFVANIGWVTEGVPGRKIGAVVIDAMHPRTLARVPTLLEQLEGIPIVVVVTPPLVERELVDLGYPNGAHAWLWDPTAQSVVASFLSKETYITSFERFIWICDDQEVDTTLSEVHELLGAVQREAQREFPPIWSAWSIYHRLRQLAVPLSLLEDSSYQTWGAVPLKKRLAQLKQEYPHEVTIEARWRGIIEQLGKAYELLLGRREPAKFWGVAERVSHHLLQVDSPLRIVMPSEREVALFSMLLGDVIDEWFEAQLAGRVEVVSVKVEPRRLAAGEKRRTLLLGFRIGTQRHLDLYPCHSVEVLSYPYEADVDEVQQDRMYDFAESLQIDEYRCEVLTALGFPHCNIENVPVCQRPKIIVAGHTENRIWKVRAPLIDPTALDLEKLAASRITQDWDDRLSYDMEFADNISFDIKQYVLVSFEDGTEVVYPPWRNVDVYHPGTDKVQRHEATTLRKGMRVVGVVDGAYERLYDRLLDALQEKVSPYHRMSILLWEQAKAAVLEKHGGNRKKLFLHLVSRGLSIDYPAVVSLFREGELEGLAPQQYSDMKVIAEYSGRYPNEAMIKLTFQVIREERGRRRNAGRALHSLLRAIVQGEGYEQAIASARQLGNEISEVFAAVQVRTVDHVQIINGGEQE